MGISSWSTTSYTSALNARRSKGIVDDFAYTASVNKGQVKAGVHEALNIFNKVRESRDSEAHPNSLAIGVVFDVTGSMSNVPRVIQEKLPKLMDMLIERGYVKDPQILIGAVGDSFSDTTPLQMGQFESGIEIEENLTKIYLEGGGGGSGEESYDHALYAFANKTSIDCYEKRQQKGYLFLIGDEKPYPQIRKEHILKHIESGESIFTTSIESLVEKVKEKYHFFFIIPKGTSNYTNKNVYDAWEKLIGSQCIIKLEDPAKICETIAVLVGANEGKCTPDGELLDIVSDEVAEKMRILNELNKKSAVEE